MNNGNQISHLRGILFVCRITPTFTTAPTIYGLNNLVTNLIANNGVENFFDGSFNTLRFHEILENGQICIPDPDTNGGTGTAFYFNRYLPMGPTSFVGAPSDFVFPVSAMAGGSLTLSYGALTSISADTTAYTASIEVVADTVGLEGEIRIPPAFERKTESLTGAGQLNLIGTRALYASMGMTAVARAPVTVASLALAAGTVGDISFDSSLFNDTPVSGAAIEALHQYQSQVGHVTQLKGELRAATDDSAKVVNSGTPTALVGADNVIQTFLAVAADQRITKLRIVSEGQVTPRWSGTQATGGMHYSRINARPIQARTDLGVRAMQKLGLGSSNVSVRCKTLTKTDYSGPRVDFMPHAIKL